MNARYKLKNGENILVYLWTDILDGEDYRESTSCNKYNKDGYIDASKDYEIKIQKDENKKLFFEFEGEKIMFDDYEYMTVNELIEKINSGNDMLKDIRDDEVLATFLKDTESVGLICELDEFDVFAKSLFGFGMTSSDDNKLECLCIPTEKKYVKSHWSYKITLEAEDESLREHYASETYYFSDLISHIRSGMITLVNRNTYGLVPAFPMQRKRVK